MLLKPIYRLYTKRFFFLFKWLRRSDPEHSPSFVTAPFNFNLETWDIRFSDNNEDKAYKHKKE
jgi:hypothetical protein